MDVLNITDSVQWMSKKKGDNFSVYLAFENQRTQSFCDNSVIRNICGSKTEEVAGGNRKLHNDERRDLYCSVNTSKIIVGGGRRWVGHGGRTRREKHENFDGET
jgi:hypothetical protein